MKYNVNGNLYDVLIERKNNKNTYIKVKENTIIISTNYFTSLNKIKKLLDDNISFLEKAINRENKKQIRKDGFYYFGKQYDIIITPLYDVEFMDNKVYTKSTDVLNKWLKRDMEKVFKEHLDYYYNQFRENIPYPILKIRSMKTRWGVCNKKNNSVTLNSELIKYDIKCLDYVIVHELSHFVHFNHSREFWNTVCTYFPEYKKYRGMLKE